jgi:TolA-binding protein
MAEGGEAGSRGALLEIARANAGALKDFEMAVQAYDRYLAREPAGSRAAQAYLEKGRVLEALAVIAEVESSEEDAVEPRAMAVESYRDAVRVGGTSEASERAQLAIIELDLADLQDQPILYYQAMSDRFREFLDAFTASDRLNEVLLRLGEANEGLGAYADSSYYEEAASVYRLLLEGEKPDEVQAEARLGLGRSLYHMNDYSEAAQLLERSLTEPAAESYRDQILFMAGDARLKTGDNQGAVAHFRELETLFPSSSWTARSSEVTGDLLLQQGRTQEAIASYRRFESSSAEADRGRARLKLATALLESGSWRECLELARLASSDSTLNDSSRLQALLLWSDSAAALDDSDQLLTAYRAVWETAPGGPEATQIAPAFGDLLSTRGELNSADEVWTFVAMNSASDSLRIRAEAELVYIAYAGNRIHTAESRRDMFEQTYRRRRDVLEKYRPMFWAVEGQVWLQSQEWDLAEAAFREIEDEAPDSDYMPIALFGLGEVAVRREEVEEARNYLEELVRRYPQDQQADRARFQLAALAYNEADYESALIYNRTAASSTDPVLAENSQYNLVLTLERMREYETAQQEALTFLERYPDSDSTFEMKMKLGELYRRGGQLGRAAPWYPSIGAPDSEEEARVRYQLAETLFMMGEYQEAVLEYMKIAYLNEDQFLFAVTARLRAADSYAYLGEKDQAVELYQGIIRRYGADSDYGRTAQAHLDNVLAGRSPGALPPPPPGSENP